MSFVIKIDSNEYHWSRQEVEQKLGNIAQLSDKKAAWIHWDLGIAPSNFLTRLIWTVVAKFFAWMRETFFNIDLEKSHSILEQIGSQIRNSSTLIDQYHLACLNFNHIAEKHKVKTKVIDKIDAINGKAHFNMLEHGFKTIEEALSFIKIYGKQLTVLNLPYKNLTNQHFNEIIEHCPNLSKLYIKGSNINHFSIRNIHLLQKLKSISFSYCPKITDQCLGAISQLENLETLIIFGSKEISHLGVRLLKGHNNLRTLDLTSCKQIDDQAVRCLQEIPSLTSLYLVSCINVTDASVPNLKNCKKLTFLSLIGTQISEQGVQSLKQNPALKTSTLHPLYLKPHFS